MSVSMNDTLRRIYNTIDSFFDRSGITQDIHFTRDGGESRQAITAMQAFSEVKPLVLELDRQAQLKMIVSQSGLNNDGTSPRWEFFFDLPHRRAQATCDWSLPWDDATDSYGSPKIEVTVKPFPPADSPIRKMVKEGKLLRQQMVGMWEQERKRRPNLHHNFRDSHIVLSEFIKQGLDPTQTEFSLSTGQSPEGKVSWTAQTRDKIYYAAFA